MNLFFYPCYAGVYLQIYFQRGLNPSLWDPMDAKPPLRQSLFSTQTHDHTFYLDVNLMDAICFEQKKLPISFE